MATGAPSYRRGPSTFAAVTTPTSTPRPADTPGAPAGVGRDVALVAVFAALVVVLALVPGVPVGPAGVPITLQTLGIMLAGLILGPWRGVAAVSVYVALGLAGLPVFAGGNSGLGVLVGSSAGYIVGWFPGTLLVGVLAVVALRRRRGRLPMLILAAALGGVVVVYACGVVGLMLLAGLDLRGAVVGGVLPFLPGDGLKVLVAALIAASVHRAFPDVLARRSSARPVTAESS